MRVIAGIAKGRRLKSPRTEGTRPILDRVKVALFDILGSVVDGATFLDLFAGTGSVGIEALSRGATKAIFIDHSVEAVKVINENLALTGLRQHSEVLRKDAFKFLEQVKGQKFDIIYIAPPQWQGLIPAALQAIDRTSLISDKGLAITQQHPKEAIPVDLTSLHVAMERKYGDTLLTFYTVRKLTSA
jgi:16S rRNA (guanine(966)-N(2))-methyltransferase RsmD